MHCVTFVQTHTWPRFNVHVYTLHVVYHSCSTGYGKHRPMCKGFLNQCYLLSHWKDFSHPSWTKTLKTSLLAVEEALLYQVQTALTIQANYFTLTIWKHVASSFWCVFSPFHNTTIWGQCWPLLSQHRQMGCIFVSQEREREEEKGNAEKQENWWNNEGKEGCRSLAGGRKHGDRVGGCREDDGFIITQALLISTVRTTGRLKSVLHVYNHTLRDTHTHTSSVETLDCFDPFKSSFPGSANHIALCARNPHRLGNHEVIWVEQTASVVVPKLLIWSGKETLNQRERERGRHKSISVFSLLNGTAELKWIVVNVH